MAGFKITAAIGQAIRASKEAGGSDRGIAREILRDFGVSLNHRAIGQYLKKTPAKPPASGGIRQATPSLPSDTGPLDPIETLQARARDLNNAILEGVEPRLWPAFNAELRQTLSSILKHEKARREVALGASADVTWVVAKLRKFDSMNKTGGAAVEEAGESDDEEVPPATRATGSG